MAAIPDIASLLNVRFWRHERSFHNPSLRERDKTDQDIVQARVCRPLAADRAHGRRNGMDSGAGFISARYFMYPNRLSLLHARTNGRVKQNIAPCWQFSAQMVPP